MAESNAEDESAAERADAASASPGAAKVSSQWSDQRKWIIGIVAALVIGCLGYFGNQFAHVWDGFARLPKFEGGIQIEAIPDQYPDAPLLVEAIHSPKKRNNFAERHYDVYIRNQTDDPVTLVSVVVDTWKLTGGGNDPRPIDDSGPEFPKVDYRFTYFTYASEQEFELERPFVVAPKDVASIRFKFEPGPNHPTREDRMKWQFRLKDSNHADYWIVRAN